VVIRADFPKGANIVHAAGESSPGNLPRGTYAVCLVVPGEKELWELEQRLRKAGLRFVSIVESDAPYTGQLMALGFAPAGKEVLRLYLSPLPLYR
jgi:hypothetical protein